MSKLLLLLLLAVVCSLVACTHCPVKKVCKPGIPFYLKVGVIMVPIPTTDCQCPVKEVENE